MPVNTNVPAAANEEGVVSRNIRPMRLSFPNTGNTGSVLPINGGKASSSSAGAGSTLTVNPGAVAGQEAAGDTQTSGDITWTAPLTMDVTVEGNGGIESTPAADSWYDLYVLQNEDGSTYAFGSLAASPTFPTGTNLFRKVGHFKFDSGLGGIVPFNGEMDDGTVKVFFTDPTAGGLSVGDLTAAFPGFAADGALHDIDLVGDVPPDAVNIEVFFTVAAGTGAALQPKIGGTFLSFSGANEVLGQFTIPFTSGKLLSASETAAGSAVIWPTGYTADAVFN